MNVNRRQFVTTSAAVLGAGLTASSASTVSSSTGWMLPRPQHSSGGWHEGVMPQPAFAIVPVVGDGKWIWKEPPNDGSKGYLEPREFEVTSGIHMRGLGAASGIQASTVTPVEFPEQEVTEFNIEAKGCNSRLAHLNDSAAQLLMSAGFIEAGQIISAVSRYRIKLCKDYRGFDMDSFPHVQKLDKKKRYDRKTGRRPEFSKQFVVSSPGISLRSKALKTLAKELIEPSLHPWEQARKFYEWVWEHIEGIPGKYTSVEDAIKNRKGDCEERATVFIALCRSAGIPARLVWVPSHNWAEIGLYDHDGTPHWIPVHTAAYSWFGWTGVHEVILQKGDRINIPHRKKQVRLIDDWYRLRGKMPEMMFTSTVMPIPVEEGEDPGPGAREKLPDGRWRLNKNHSAQKLMRDQ